MGWWFPYGASRQDVIDEVTRSRRWEAGGHVFEQETVRQCARGWSNLWTVLEQRKDGEVVDRLIVLYLLRRCGDSWGYKDVCATMGPSEVNCPLGYLELAGEPHNDYEAEWRADVRDYHARRSLARSQRKEARS